MGGNHFHSQFGIDGLASHRCIWRCNWSVSNIKRGRQLSGLSELKVFHHGP
jgi:hypothetical protein